MRTYHSYVLHLVVATGDHSQCRLGEKLSQECVVGREFSHCPAPGEGEEGSPQGGGVGMGEKAKKGHAV